MESEDESLDVEYEMHSNVHCLYQQNKIFRNLRQ